MVLSPSLSELFRLLLLLLTSDLAELHDSVGVSLEGGGKFCLVSDTHLRYSTSASRSSGSPNRDSEFVTAGGGVVSVMGLVSIRRRGNVSLRALNSEMMSTMDRV